VTAVIDRLRGRFGVEPICRVLEVSPSTYYARRVRPPSDRDLDDAWLTDQIRRVWEDSYGVYGARRVWRQLRREDIDVARCTVERLMADEGLEGVQRGARRRTTVPEPSAPRPADLVCREFVARRPDQLWLADLTYIRIAEGFVYCAFVLDVFSRRIVGWQLADHLRTDLPLDALEMAIWQRNVQRDALVHHSDAGCQYTSIRYSERLDDSGIAASVGTVGDSYDNAMAESLNGSFKSELIERRKWSSRVEVELAIVEWIGWYNHRRLHSSLGYVPPVEFEAEWYSARDSAILSSK